MAFDIIWILWYMMLCGFIVVCDVMWYVMLRLQKIEKSTWDVGSTPFDWPSSSTLEQRSQNLEATGRMNTTKRQSDCSECSITWKSSYRKVSSMFTHHWTSEWNQWTTVWPMPPSRPSATLDTASTKLFSCVVGRWRLSSLTMHSNIELSYLVP